MNIPLALIGVVWGHKLMGLDITMPSMIGFVSLAGIVVNDSILLVEFVKRRCREGMALHDAAGQAVRDRFRAIFLTSITTIGYATAAIGNQPAGPGIDSPGRQCCFRNDFIDPAVVAGVAGRLRDHGGPWHAGDRR